MSERERGRLRAVAKGAFDAVAVLIVLPFVGLTALAGLLWRRRSDQHFQGMSQFFALWPRMPGDFIRRAFYRLTVGLCARDCLV